MKKLIYLVFPFAAILLLLGLSILFNYSVVEVRLDDLNSILSQAAKSQAEDKALGMLAKYELIKRRMERRAETSDDYELETRVQAILMSGGSDEKTPPMSRVILKKPARIVLSFIRMLMGKELRAYEEDVSKERELIEVGYFWERNRHYDRAISIYQKILGTKDLNKGLQRYVMLHNGFCLSMVSKYRESKAMYEEVIREFPDSEAAVIAWKLLDFIDQISTRLTSINKRSMSDFERGKNYYLLMDYRGAIKSFSKLLRGNKRFTNRAEALFLKGRSHEELGENHEAQQEYQEIIKNHSSSKWAKEANRRMYILGEFYERDQEMTKAAVERIQKFRDDNFFDKMNTYSGMMGENEKENKIREKMKKITARESDGMTAKDVENLLDNLDLTGEVKQQKMIKKQKEENTRKRKQAAILMKRELEQRRQMENPFRSPSAIKSVISRNQSELQYIYQRYLRRGKDFEGKMTVSLSIDPDGTVSKATVISSSISDNEFTAKVLEKIETWKFKKVPDNVGILSVRYPLEFRKRQ